MTCPPRPSIAARELWFPGIPPDDGRQDRENRRSAADGSPLSFLRAYWQSMWPISRNRRRNGPRLVGAPPRQSIADDQARNGEPAELSLATEDYRRPNRWPCSAAGILPAPAQRGGPESSRRPVSSGPRYSGSPAFLRSAYPVRFSKRTRRPPRQCLACFRSARRSRLFLAPSAA